MVLARLLRSISGGYVKIIIMEKIDESNWSKATKETLRQEDQDKLMAEARGRLAQEQRNLESQLKAEDNQEQEYKKAA